MTGEEIARLRQAMLLGTTRQPLVAPPALAPILNAAPPSSDRSLLLLALVGQRRRFERPDLRAGHEVPEAAHRMHADARPILPASARRALGRLANGLDRSIAAPVVAAAMRRIAAAGFRLHPFDLPRLAPYLKTAASSLGLAERAFLALSENRDRNAPPDLLHTEITAENWTEFPKGFRRHFLREERLKDPAAARTLLEGALKSEPAAIRAELIEALAVGLGADDQPFLERMAKDRAESVRTAAAALVSRMRGTAAHAARLAEAARCFERSGSAMAMLQRLGLAAPGAVRFVVPKGADFRERMLAEQRLFEGLSLPDLTAATSFDPGDLLASLPEDDIALMALHATAVQEGDDATIQRIVEARLTTGRAYPAPHVLLRLAEPLPAPVSGAVARLILSSAGWAGVVQRSREEAAEALKGDDTLVVTALALPASVMPVFLETIEPMPAGTARSAREFAELVLALDAAAGSRSPTPMTQAQR